MGYEKMGGGGAVLTMRYPSITMRNEIDPLLPLVQDADLDGKMVLVRVDHNVVKKGKITDTFRIDQTFATLCNILANGGRLILMTLSPVDALNSSCGVVGADVGRPYNSKTRAIEVGDDTSVAPVVNYLQSKLKIKLAVPTFTVHETRGIRDIDTSINLVLRDLRDRRIGGIYLPNTRWFEGEEGKFGPESRNRLALQLAGLADVFVNDAFGSWQPHVTTNDITRYLPSYAGLLMQSELINLKAVMEPSKPFVAVVAGAKFDTKVGPCTAIWKHADTLVLGGVLYNAWLCAKYCIRVKGVSEEDIQLAAVLVDQDRDVGKVLELPEVVESDTLETREEGKWRVVKIADLKAGQEYNYFLDVGPEAFNDPRVAEVFGSARTIFINAVMGYTQKGYCEGTAALDKIISRNLDARKLFGGGDTLQEFKDLLLGLYMRAIDDAKYYLFTGGGTVLTAIQKGSPYMLEPVASLLTATIEMNPSPTMIK